MPGPGHVARACIITWSRSRAYEASRSVGTVGRSQARQRRGTDASCISVGHPYSLSGHSRGVNPRADAAQPSGAKHFPHTHACRRVQQRRRAVPSQALRTPSSGGHTDLPPWRGLPSASTRSLSHRCGPQGPHRRPCGSMPPPAGTVHGRRTEPLGHQQSLGDGVRAEIAFLLQVRPHGV